MLVDDTSGDGESGGDLGDTLGGLVGTLIDRRCNKKGFELRIEGVVKSGLIEWEFGLSIVIQSMRVRGRVERTE